MALQIKTGFTEQDQIGNIYSEAYLVIDQINIDKRAKEVIVFVTIYKSKQDRIDGFDQIGSLSKVYVVRADIFDELFAPKSGENISIWTQAYKYVASLKENNDLIFGNWEDA